MVPGQFCSSASQAPHGAWHNRAQPYSQSRHHHPVVPVHQRRDGVLVHRSDVRPQIDAPSLNTLAVLRQPENPVRVHAAKIGFRHARRAGPCVRLRQSQRLQHTSDEPLQTLHGIDRIGIRRTHREDPRRLRPLPSVQSFLISSVPRRGPELRSSPTRRWPPRRPRWPYPPRPPPRDVRAVARRRQTLPVPPR
jgi:hypothetical protein